jgi:hypothetical protein
MIVSDRGDAQRSDANRPGDQIRRRDIESHIAQAQPNPFAVADLDARGRHPERYCSAKSLDGRRKAGPACRLPDDPRQPVLPLPGLQEAERR